MSAFIYAMLTLIYIFLIIAGIFCHTSWFWMIWLIYGVVHFGSKFMTKLEERGL